MNLNGDSILKSCLGLGDDPEKVSAEEWVHDVLSIDVPASEASAIMDNMMPLLCREYERYQAWMDEHYCKSRVNFDDYYALLMQESMDNDDDSLVSIFDRSYDEKEFKLLEEQAVGYLEAKGHRSCWGDEGIVLGHHLTAFLHYLYYSIDEISQEIVSILLSKDRFRSEKIHEAGQLIILKELLGKAMGSYCYNWSVLREGRTALEFAIGFFNNRFHFSGSTVDMCACESGLSSYSDSLFDYFLTKEDKQLTEEVIIKAHKLIEDILRITGIFKQKEKALGDKCDLVNIEDYTLETYIPYSAEKKDELLYSIKDNAVAELYWYFLEMQGQISNADLVLNILRTCEGNSDTINWSAEELDDLYDELEFDRNDMLRLVYSNARKARRLATDFSAEQIEAREQHLLDCWKLMDALEGMIEATSIDDADKYMRSSKSIIDKAESIEDGTLIKARMDHIVSLMEQRLEELSRSENIKEQLEEKIEREVGSLQNINRDFLIPLSGGEKLYSMFIDNCEDNTDFDYTCIAIMYYTALETLLTQYLYVNYLKKVGIMDRNGNTSFIDIEEANSMNRRYFANKVKLQTQRSRNVVVSGRFPEFCELGSFKHYYSRQVIDRSSDLRSYLREDLGIQDLGERIRYCERVYRLKDGRNKAAHGMHIVSYGETQAAKRDTFIEQINTMNGLIIDFIKLIRGQTP